MSPINNHLATLITLTALSGVIIHDTQINSVAAAAEKKPASSISREFEMTEIEPIHPSQHIHVESLTFFSATYGSNSQQPSTRPRNENDGDKKYVTRERLAGDMVSNTTR